MIFPICSLFSLFKLFILLYSSVLFSLLENRILLCLLLLLIPLMQYYPTPAGWAQNQILILAKFTLVASIQTAIVESAISFLCYHQSKHWSCSAIAHDDCLNLKFFSQQHSVCFSIAALILCFVSWLWSFLQIFCFCAFSWCWSCNTITSVACIFNFSPLLF